MGLLNALVQSSSRFQDELLPVGYEERRITWVITISSQAGQQPTITKKGREDLTIRSPSTPTDRTSSISPTLLVDKISYLTGMPDNKKKGDSKEIARKEHRSYIALLRLCAKQTQNQQILQILNFLRKCSPYIRDAKSTDLCVFQIGKEQWPTDDEKIQNFWSKYVAKRLSKSKGQCVLCGNNHPIPRIFPFKTTLLKGTGPIQLSSFNRKAFCSAGSTPDSALNASICYECAGKAGQVLQFLLKLEDQKNSGRHAVVLARDDSKGRGKQPLRNQIAVFWTKKSVELEDTNDGQSRTFEDLVKAPIEDLDDIPDDTPPAKVGQIRKLLEAPFAGGNNALHVPTNRFYLAVLSPNKSRLVVREWLETDIEPVRDNIKRYMDAVQITHPDGRGVWAPPMPAMLEALQAYTSKKKEYDERPSTSALGPDVVRKLIRCIYTGTLPPEALLTRALRCFRIPDPPADQRLQKERQMLRRMAMAAAMKFILTYDKNRKEQRAMEELKTEYDTESDYKKSAPYNCGVLLAILEAIQRRSSSSGKGVNTTLVDRFYGAASTAPATVFANLINMATKAHLPKLRRENKEFFRVKSQNDSVNINDLMTEACDAINGAGGFPPPLTPEQQAAFALGFYHQRAEFSLPPSKKPKTNNNDKTNNTGGQS